VSTDHAALIAHPIPAAWISAGGTGAQNYDEFASDAEITAIIEANPESILAVDMPHCAPESVAAGLGFADALPFAAERLARLKEDGRFQPASDVVAPYRIDTHAGPAYGLFCLIDTDQISASADQPGLVIRNEDVFAEKVAERTALTRYLHHLLSPVLLLQSGRRGQQQGAAGAELQWRLEEAIERLGPPVVSDVDQHGHTHQIWLLGPGPEQDALLAAAGGGELIVADGNHRTLSAQEAGLSRFLAVVTTAESVGIQPYHRLLRHLNQPVEDVLAALNKAGATVLPLLGDPRLPDHAGTVTFYADGQTYSVTLPPAEGSVVERLDHAVLERVLFADILGLGAGDKSISYIGGDYPPSWLAGEVDNGRAAAALLLAPVTVGDFVEVNLARLKMPRKSTWFTPKARTGLILVDLDAAATDADAPGLRADGGA
jgi:uncharacterized protein (DUF1015 family)